METKEGEIFEYNGEWYQCIVENGCENCAFNERKCYTIVDECGADRRKDNKNVIFKKLEKVGEPYTHYCPSGRIIYFQRYKIFNKLYSHNTKYIMCDFNEDDIVSIELKQTKEDMEENNDMRPYDELFSPGTVSNTKYLAKEGMEEKKLIELLSEKVHNAWMKEKEAQGFSYGKEYDKENKKHPDMLPYNELKEEVKEYDRATVRAVLQAQKELQSEYNYNNLKPFNLEAAKTGKPVCTRDGRKARIICWDRKDEDNYYNIVALIENKGKDKEEVRSYYNNGKYLSGDEEAPLDLMMLPEKKEGWVNVYDDTPIYDTKEEALNRRSEIRNYIDTVKVSWEE